MKKKSKPSDEFEVGFNPTVWGDKRIISKIVRCPNKRSKISINTCRKCPDYNGIDGDFVLCNYRMNKRNKDGTQTK